MSSGIGSAPKQRFGHLDGLRTVAIFWVALYHYAVFWTPAGRGQPLMPQGDGLSWIPMASVGHLGVNLFFILSGFVIFYSLDRSKSLLDFAVKRAIRLWPTYLFCASLTFFTALMVGPSELVREPIEYVVSLTFMPPNHVGLVFGHPEWRWLDGAYWSLWVEVRFYIIIGVLFFVAAGRFLWAWIGFNLIALIIHLLWMTTGSSSADNLSGVIFAEFLPFFNAGISLALLHKGQVKRLATVFLSLSIAQSLLYSTGLGLDVEHFFGLFFIYGITIVAVLRPVYVSFLNQKHIVLIGQSSYVFYLLHQNFGISIIHNMEFNSYYLTIISVFLGFIFIVFFSIAVHLLFELRVQKYLKYLYVSAKSKWRPAVVGIGPGTGA